jgi:putative ABC transport system substrate-binding protein
MRRLVLGVEDLAFLPRIAATVTELVGFLSLRDRRQFTQAGLLMSYGPNISDLYRRAAIYVDKILRGAVPAVLPVEQPTKFELIINLKTAKALGLDVSLPLQQRADQMIE